MELISILILSLAIIYLLSSKKSKSTKLPLGPKGIPFLGNLPQIVQDPHLKLSKWAQKYGSLFTIYFGPKAALILSSPKVMKEILGTAQSTGKFKTDTLLLISQGQNGIVNSEGESWLEQRQFCMRALRQFGFGNSRSTEPLILAEVEQVCKWVEQSKEPVVLGQVLKTATANALWTVVSGERMSFEDSKVSERLDEFSKALQTTMKTGLGFLPMLKHVTPEMSGYNAFDKACKDIHRFIENKFEEHLKDHVEGQRKDVMDCYIEHWKGIQDEEASQKASSFKGDQGWRNCVSSVVEIFLSGGETTATAVNWAMVYLSLWPQVQDKVIEEIDKVVGRGRDPSLADRPRMPYTEAVINETLRMASLAPLGVIHELVEDLAYNGYTLPKGLLLVPNIYHCHHSGEIWGDPEVFRPERFLDVEGQLNNLKDLLVPFQAGKRQCLGESLAREVLFLFVVKMVQEFEVKLDPIVEREEYLKPDVGLLLLPQALGIVMTSRE